MYLIQGRVNYKSTPCGYVSRGTMPRLCLNRMFYHHRYLLLIGYSRVEGAGIMEVALEFLVQGSEPEPYHVTFRRTGEQLIAGCTCAGAAAHQLCKHRLALLAGDVTAVVSGNAAAVQQLPAVMAGTALELAYGRVIETERGVEAAKRLAHAARKALGRIMQGL
jgi:hypothetical protein